MCDMRCLLETSQGFPTALRIRSRHPQHRLQSLLRPGPCLSFLLHFFPLLLAPTHLPAHHHHLQASVPLGFPTALLSASYTTPRLSLAGQLPFWLPSGFRHLFLRLAFPPPPPLPAKGCPNALSPSFQTTLSMSSHTCPAYIMSLWWPGSSSSFSSPLFS